HLTAHHSAREVPASFLHDRLDRVCRGADPPLDPEDLYDRPEEQDEGQRQQHTQESEEAAEQQDGEESDERVHVGCLRHHHRRHHLALYQLHAENRDQGPQAFARLIEECDDHGGYAAHPRSHDRHELGDAVENAEQQGVWYADDREG